MSWGTISGGPINFGVWNSLYPYNYATNYGGQFQYCTMPFGISAQEAFEVQNVLNVPFQMNRFYTNLATIPAQLQAQNNSIYAQQAAAMGAAMGSNIVINARVRTLAGNIASVKSQIEQALKHTGLNATQKAELEQLKKEIEEFEQDLETLQKERQRGATDEEVKEELTALEEGLNSFTSRVKEVGDRITKELSDSTSGSDPASGAGSASGSDPASGAGTGTGVDAGAASNPGFDKKGRPTALPAAPEAKDMRTWCDKFHTAVNDRWLGFGNGTDNTAFEACLEAIDESNVMELIDYYDKNYGSDGLISDFINDASHKQLVNFVPRVLNALITRAELLGIDSAVADDASKIHKELNAINISESKVIKHLKNIVDAIKKEEAKKAAASAKPADAATPTK